jgi:hypothetical protein
MFLRRVGLSPNYSALEPRRLYIHRFENLNSHITLKVVDLFIIANACMKCVTARGIQNAKVQRTHVKSLCIPV